MSCYRNHATKIELIFLILAKWTKLFCENVLFFLKRHSHLMKKGLHNSMQPLFVFAFFPSYFAGVCVPVAGNVGTISASVD